MKLHTHPAGKVSVVVLDQHTRIYQHATDTTDELWDWLKEQDTEAQDGEAFCLSEADWNVLRRGLPDAPRETSDTGDE